MKKASFSELIDINTLKNMVENIYAAAGIPIGIIDAIGTINIAVGWQDICTKFHRANPDSCKRCRISDQYIREKLLDGKYIEYKCLNNMWDIGMPVIIRGQHMATIFMGQFFYEDEIIDIEYFRSQALEFGFDEKEYLGALKRVPRFSKEKIKYIIEYYLGLIKTLAESSIREIEYREHKKELEKSQKYLSTIFNSVSDAIFIHDTDGNIYDVNATAISMFGFDRNEMMNININDLSLKCEDGTKFDFENLAKDVYSKKPFIKELIAKNKDNIEFWIEVNFNITNIDEDEKIIATVRNVTERKKAELAAKNEAIELERLRTEFFANISHELRTPLNIILCVIQVIEIHIKNLEKEIDRNKIINNINIERQNCYRLLRLINNLIDSTKLNLGYFDTNMINYDIVSLVKEITLSVSEYINNNNLKLEFKSDLDKKVVACDPDKIERIMLNLLSNAIKFTKSGGSILVNIFEDEGYISISIKDTGIGIPKEKLNLIFDRFAQVDKSFTRNNEGSGIGLYLVKLLVEMHGGKISVESTYGSGTKFVVKIPLRILDCNGDQNTKNLINNEMKDYLETIKVEFSDIYK